MTLREKILAFINKHGTAIVVLAASALFLYFRLRVFFRYGLTQDEVLIISQIKTWDIVKIWHYYGFGGHQGGWDSRVPLCPDTAPRSTLRHPEYPLTKS